MEYDVTDFEKGVIERSFDVPVLVDFWAEWCGPCRILGPVLERLAEQSGGRWVLAKLDTERFPEIASRYGIRGIPSVKLFVEGRVSAEFTGALPEPAVRQWLEKQLPGKHQKNIDQAEALLKSGLVKEARALLEPAVQAEPGHQKARALLAQILLEENPVQAMVLVEGIEEDSPQFEIAESVRVFGSLMRKLAEPSLLPDTGTKKAYLEALERLKQKEYSEALERFIRIIRDDRHYDDDGSRKACIAVFRLLGEDHEITVKHRRDFSSALY